MGILRCCCLGIGVLAAGQPWADGCHVDSYGTLPVDMIGARPTTMVKINGADTRLILDTGAFFSIMSNATAHALKLVTRPMQYGFRISGVGGEASAEIASVEQFGILGATLHDVEFIVGGSDAGDGLLGANLLDFTDVEIDLAGGKLTLFKTEHCTKALLAYWVKDGDEYNFADLDPSYKSYDKRTYLTVTINGKKLRALLDSGAEATVLSRDAAEQVGIDLKAPSVKAGGYVGGFGSKRVKACIAPVDSLSVGTETINHSQIQVIDGTFGDNDMLLGVDFLLAHHMFIANKEGKAYFTYNGGRVFTFAAAQGDVDKSDVDKSADGKGATSKTASDYALLGQAHLSRGEPKAAIADLSEAIRLAPDQAAYYLALARAQATLEQLDPALASLDKSLSLEPRNADALLLRASLRLLNKDRTGAAADAAAASALVPAGSSQALWVAELYMKLEQPAAALPMLDDWIRLHDDDSGLGAVLNERCWARSLSRQMLDDARKDCRKAIRRDGEKPAYLDSLGLVELRLGHYPDSIKAYQKAIAGHSQSAWSHYGLGLAELRDGQTDAGNADLATARGLDPQIEELAGSYGLTAAGP